jgi:hypothetical protein
MHKLLVLLALIAIGASLSWALSGERFFSFSFLELKSFFVWGSEENPGEFDFSAPWAIQVRAGVDPEALAESLGLEFLGPVGSLKGIYLVRVPEEHQRAEFHPQKIEVFFFLVLKFLNFGTHFPTRA